MSEFEKSSISRYRHKRIHTTTVLSISMVLLMMGIATMLTIQATKLGNYVKENIVVNIYIKESAKEKDIDLLIERLRKLPSVKSADFISKEAAAKALSKELGEDFVNFIGYNPLLYSIDVKMNSGHANNQDLKKFATNISRNEIVKDVVYQSSLISELNKNIRIVYYILLALGIVLLIISFGLINNTIRLAIFSQRFLIRSMQLVGATNGFIRKPFLNTAILNGTLSGIIASGIIISMTYFAKNKISELSTLKMDIEFVLLAALLILLGVIISWVSTLFSVNKFLNLRSIDKLYTY